MKLLFALAVALVVLYEHGRAVQEQQKTVNLKLPIMAPSVMLAGVR